MTERVVVGPEDWVTVTNLRQLRSAGVQVSNDDFATGYSALASLHRLRVSRVKIDKQFVDSLPGAPGKEGWPE
ncbi:EAL domain-containing protein [Thiohalorhabdus sp.]|uniref:EAL domain-containing protein n=1 Tax=Thiohalorhabdus sp. TaxID=3094134 RepID=UPI002FC2991A